MSTSKGQIGAIFTYQTYMPIIKSESDTYSCFVVKSAVSSAIIIPIVVGAAGKASGVIAYADA
eukprot:scaffold32644_cov14-Prasinocladus_malaysianus.AAC.1